MRLVVFRTRVGALSWHASFLMPFDAARGPLPSSPLAKAMPMDFMFQRSETLTNSREAEHLPCV